MAYNRRKGVNFVGGKRKKKKPLQPFKGITYKSGLERNMAVLLDAANIPFKYESEVFEVLPTFRFPLKSYERQGNGKGDMINRGEKKVLGIKYTPDFIGEGFIIETKGYANESFPMRWKMFKHMLFEQGVQADDLVIYKPQKISECEQVIILIKEHQKDVKGTKKNSKQ